jgi:homoserine O-acetyltransferase/O-succinyltransferase
MPDQNARPAAAPAAPQGTQGVRIVDGLAPIPSDFRLEHGGRVHEGRIAYRLLGIPGKPVVAVLGGISAHRRVAAQEGDGEPGWWEWMVGVGNPIDLRSHRVLSIDWLCGRGDSSGRIVEAGPVEGNPVAVPLVTPTDQAHTLDLVTRHLELEPLCGLIGASYGGSVALAFAAVHPERVLRTLVIGAADRSHPLATALRVVQRRIVQRGVAAGDEAGGVALGRALAMTTYRSDVEFDERFSGPSTISAGGVHFPVEDYIDHNGRAFARRFTAAQFLCLSQSSDLHFVDAGDVRTPVTLVSTDPDFIAPRWQMEDLARRMGDPHELIRLSSPHGHDAFLTDQARFSTIVREFIAGCRRAPAGAG